eukprot:Em0001g1105a
MELRIELSFVLFKTDTDQIFGLCFSEESSAQEMGSYLIQMASLSVADQLTKSEGLAFRSNSAPYFSQTNAPASLSFETVRPLELSTTHSSSEQGQMDSDSSKTRGMGARHPSGTPVKKTEKNKQNVQLSRQKLYQPMSNSYLSIAPVTSTSIEQVFSIPHTAPTLSQSIYGSEKEVPFLQPVQSNPTVSTSVLVSPGSFSSKVTGNGPSGDALASAGNMGTLQSLFSSIELKTPAIHVPAGAFSLAEVENKLQTDQLSLSGQVIPSPSHLPQSRSGLVLMQPSVYAAASTPINPQDTVLNEVLVTSNEEEKQSLVSGSADKSGFHFKNLAPQLPDHKSSVFPSIPPLMLSAGMKASPMRGVLKEKEPLQDNKNVKTEVSPLTKAELQKALLHLIEHDDEFLSCIHSVYMQTHSQNIS